MTEPTSGYPTPKNYDSAIEHGSFTFLNNNPEGGYTLLTPTITECPRCLFTSDVVSIPREGQCEYCLLHDSLEASAVSFAPILNKIKRKGKNKKYDCLIGISGGLDSSTLLYAAVKKWNLRPLVIHFCNHYNIKQAGHNIRSLIQTLDVDAQVHYVNKKEYDAICRALLRSGLPDADIANDLAMAQIMAKAAYDNGIKVILNGHDFRTEGSSPRSFTYMDHRYISDIYQKNKLPSDPDMLNFPAYTFAKQLWYALAGIKHIRPFHYADVKRPEIEREMKAVIGYKEYAYKHAENTYTDYVGTYLLPVKYGISKNLTYLSAQIRTGTITKDEAKQKLCNPVQFDLSKISKDFTDCVTVKIGKREDYKKYNFRRWKPLLWVLMKMNLFSRTFYTKYAQ